MVASRKREIKVSPVIKPHDREVRIKSNPESNYTKKPAWNVGLIDLNCPWCFKELDGSDWWNEIHAKLKNFETMTWQEIFDASGGRKRGNNNHGVPIKDLVPEARRRLRELRLNDIESLFSLRLTGTRRIWGILDGFVLKIMWFDSGHKVCPTAK